MSEEEKNRKQEVEDYKNTLKETRKEASQVKEAAQQKVESNKEICVEMDELQDTLSKEEKVAESLTDELVANMPREAWGNMQLMFGHAANNYRIASSLRRDMEGARTQVHYFQTTATTLVGSNSTNALSAVHFMAPYADQYPPVGKALATVKLVPTWMDDITFIKAELKRITPNVSKAFEGVVAEMSGAGDPDLKHKVLLSLRSVLFDQLLNIVAPKGQIDRTAWFQLTPPKTPHKQLRFCQTKFFIFGNRDEAAFPQSTIDAVNKASNEMELHFHEMSEYGKNRAPASVVDNCYRQTMTSFANAIRLRNDFQRHP